MTWEELKEKAKEMGADVFDEYKKLQEQLKEANDALFSLCSPTAYSLKPAMDYLNKWGVK